MRPNLISEFTFSKATLIFFRTVGELLEEKPPRVPLNCRLKPNVKPSKMKCFFGLLFSSAVSGPSLMGVGSVTPAFVPMSRPGGIPPKSLAVTGRTGLVGVV